MKTLELAIYTTRICSNTSIFKEEYVDTLTMKIVDSAQRIHICAWKANNILVKDNETAKRRFQYQKEAHELCNDLLAYMQMARSIYHLRAGRMKYWSTLVIECRNGLFKWNEKDTRRYSEYK